ncbi:unnamed protein product [Effrenium voratum]|nr:unnamed protein product [Effrenium voratum]
MARPVRHPKMTAANYEGCRKGQLMLSPEEAQAVLQALQDLGLTANWALKEGKSPAGFSRELKAKSAPKAKAKTRDMQQAKPKPKAKPKAKEKPEPASTKRAREAEEESEDRGKRQKAEKGEAGGQAKVKEVPEEERAYLESLVDMLDSDQEDELVKKFDGTEDFVIDIDKMTAAERRKFRRTMEGMIPKADAQKAKQKAKADLKAKQLAKANQQEPETERPAPETNVIMDASQDVPPPGEPAASTAAWRRVLYGDPAPAPGVPVDVAPASQEAVAELSEPEVAVAKVAGDTQGAGGEVAGAAMEGVDPAEGGGAEVAEGATQGAGDEIPGAAMEGVDAAEGGEGGESAEGAEGGEGAEGAEGAEGEAEEGGLEDLPNVSEDILRGEDEDELEKFLEECRDWF